MHKRKLWTFFLTIALIITFLPSGTGKNVPRSGEIWTNNNGKPFLIISSTHFNPLCGSAGYITVMPLVRSKKKNADILHSSPAIKENHYYALSESSLLLRHNELSPTLTKEWVFLKPNQINQKALDEKIRFLSIGKPKTLSPKYLRGHIHFIHFPHKFGGIHPGVILSKHQISGKTFLSVIQLSSTAKLKGQVHLSRTQTNTSKNGVALTRMPQLIPECLVHKLIGKVNTETLQEIEESVIYHLQPLLLPPAS